MKRALAVIAFLVFLALLFWSARSAIKSVHQNPDRAFRSI